MQEGDRKGGSYMRKVAVLGAGSWGTALALVLADNGFDVRLWTHRKEQAEAINKTHRNDNYLKDIDLPSTIRAVYDLDEALNNVEAVLLGVPTKAIREICQRLNHHLDHKVLLIHAAKGVEPGTYKRVSEMIIEELNSKLFSSVVVLSGPSHAEEVSLRHPTTVTVSSESLEDAKHAQDLFFNENFRVYTNPDILGVELGGALKNIIALGAGISDGLGYGDNAKAALITRGLAEITKLGSHLGANPITFMGLSGMGDLIVTCTSVHSRNWRAGNLLGKGNNLDDVLEKMGMVVEGVRTTEAAYHLAKSQGVEMPITEGIYRILYDKESPKAVVDQLMTRVKKHEMEHLPNIFSK